MLRWRSGPLFLVVVLLVAMLGAACSDDDDDGTPTATPTGGAATTATSTSAGSGDAFPVVVEHKYGETEITEKPERIVSVGYSEQDSILAFGIKPVGVRYWYGDYDHATWPWAQDELGDAQPEIIGEAELDLEAIAALDPDLIVGITSGMTEDEYRLLSQIAPTLPQPGEFVDYGVPWRDEVRMMGRAFGLSERAEEIIADVEAQFAQVREDHPKFGGQTAAVAFYFNDQPGAYSSQDARSRLMTELGFVIPERFDELAGDLFYFSVSNEQITELDADVIVWLSATDDGIQTIRDLPLRSQLRASAEGREVFVGALLGGAFSFGSALSIPYLLENLVPMLAAAVDGDPATAVQ